MLGKAEQATEERLEQREKVCWENKSELYTLLFKLRSPLHDIHDSFSVDPL